jgi:hypothetical protein
MTFYSIPSFLFLSGLIGCVLFFILVIVIFRTRLVYTARKPDGTLKDVVPIRGKLALTIIPISYFVFQVSTNYIGIVQQGIFLKYWSLFLLNYGVYLILFLFDTFFIDGFMLAIWRPDFLELPDELNVDSMKKHIRISIPVGLRMGILLTFISTTTTYVLWLN